MKKMKVATMMSIKMKKIYDNSSNRLLFTSVKENDDHNTLIEDKIGKEETKDENEEYDIQQVYYELYGLCEILTKKNKTLKGESKRLVDDVSILKDELMLKNNDIRDLEHKLTTLNENLAHAHNEVHNLQSNLESSQLESKYLQMKLIKGKFMLINSIKYCACTNFLVAILVYVLSVPLINSPSEMINSIKCWACTKFLVTRLV